MSDTMDSMATDVDQQELAQQFTATVTAKAGKVTASAPYTVTYSPASLRAGAQSPTADATVQMTMSAQTPKRQQQSPRR